MSYLLLIFAISGSDPIVIEFSSLDLCLQAKEELYLLQPSLKTKCIKIKKQVEE